MSDERGRLDVLVVGGGVQGLSLLAELTDRGYAVGVVTDAPVGTGQSLHWHGVLTSGYTDPDARVRESVLADWLPFLDRLGVRTYGDDAYYVFATDEVRRRLTAAWDELGYAYREADREALPGPYRDGPLGRDESVSVLAVDEYCLDRRELVEALVTGHEANVVVGDVVGYEFGTGADTTGDERTDGQPTVEAVSVLTRGGETVRLEPAYVVAATGAGTHAFFESIVSDEGFLAAGGDPARVRQSLAPVTSQNVHMLTLRGPASELPAVSAYVTPSRLKVVSHRHERDGEPTVTTYVTNKPLAPVAPEDASGDALGVVDPDHVAAGFRALFDAVPGIREAAARPGSRVEFGVYAGIKQSTVDGSNVPHVGAVDGLGNVGLALPSVMGAARLSTAAAADAVADAVSPSGPVEGVDGGGDPPVGETFDRGGEMEWLDWEALTARYPGILSPRASATRTFKEGAT
jgi:glycine/D-amino acid oxidase-like deaminating enzyme